MIRVLWSPVGADGLWRRLKAAGGFISLADGLLGLGHSPYPSPIHGGVFKLLGTP